MGNYIVMAGLGMFFLIIGSGFLGGSVIQTISYLESKLPSDSDAIATVRYVDKIVASNKTEEKITYTHFFYDGKEKIMCNKIDERGDEIKVECQDRDCEIKYFGCRCFYFKDGTYYDNCPNTSKWIEKSKVFKVMSIEELSEAVAKQK